jgi:hypothetical protein
MTPSALVRWHEIVASKDPRGLDSLLAEDVVFHSPVVHTPQVGKGITKKYLTAALAVFSNDSFRYVREVYSDSAGVLEFLVEIDGVVVNGVDIISWNADAQILEFKVMIRPLRAIQLIHQKMAAALSASD